MTRLAFLPLVLCASTVLAEEPGLAGGERRVREIMHTRVTIAIVDPAAPEALASAFDEAFAVFQHVDEEMNEWRPDSPLSRVNAAAGGAAVEAPADLCDALSRSLEGARRTNGLFDPAWAALRGLWNFADDQPFRLPADDAVTQRCSLVGWKDVDLASRPDGTCTVRLARRGMALGLGGFVKGWGVDRAVALLRSRGFRNFFVQAGGDLYAAGKRGDRPWRVGIRDPRGPPESTFAVAEIEDAAFSTSGDYEHFAIVEGVRYHHIIDLRTCRPAMASRSATIYAKSASDAEFLTKSAFVLGGKEGLKLAESFGAGAVLVDASGAVHLSPSLRERVKLRPPRP